MVSNEPRFSGSVLVHPGVFFEGEPQLGDYVILGVPVSADREGPIPTRFGEGAVIRSHSVIYCGNRVGRKFQTGHSVLVREHNEIGDEVSIGSHTILEHHTKIGHRVRIHSAAFIPEFSEIEEGAWIGPRVVFTNARYPKGRGAKENLKGPIIRQGAIIGANSTLLPGIVVGKNSLIGAGSVVVRDVPDGVVVVGNPARVLRPRARIPQYGDAGSEAHREGISI